MNVVGDKGALLRRERLPTSQMEEWRQAREAGALHRGGTALVVPKGTADTAALAKSNREVERLEAQLAKTRMALDIVGKAHALLEVLSEGAYSEFKPTS